MRKYSFLQSLIFLTISCFLTFSCQKGINWDDKNNTTTTTVTSDYGWSLKYNDTASHGCIDTAYYDAAGSAKTLQVTVTDSMGNSILLVLTSATGSFSTGTYGSSTNNGTIIFTRPGNNGYLITASNTSFSFIATTINDTIVVGTFTATLLNASNQMLTITDGKIKALIGKENVCGSTNNGTSTSIGGNDSAAVFTLIKGTGSKCATVNVKGTYASGTEVDNTDVAQVDINVTKTGKFNVVTETSNGISFSAQGTLNTTGNQTLTLQATGTPVVPGTTSIPITVGSSNCSFTVVVQ